MAGKLTLSVSQLNEYVRRMFQLDPMLHGIEVRGEISNLKIHQTGTLFFTLKDEGAAISCVMYASETENLQAAPFDGMRAIVSGSVGFYARGGQTQLYVSGLSAQGVGVLYERLLTLKARLSAEGLFDVERKRPIPGFQNTIGVVTSPTGAVIHDILNVSLRRDPQAQILLCPVRVQGLEAADDVVRAIRLLDRLESVSVIIVARGGGSIEDLWTFNEERVVRAVAACGKPIVSAVGHETDVTLCDLAADLRAPTPSAAAECVVARREELTQRLDNVRAALRDAAYAKLEKERSALALDAARLAAQHPRRRLEAEQVRLKRAADSLRRAAALSLSQREGNLAVKRRELELLSPYGVLSRGYAIVTRGGVAAERAAQLHEDDQVAIRFQDGIVRAKILDAYMQEEET